MKTYEEKLQELLDNKEATPIEWSQSNEEKKNGYTETEVTFKYKIKTPVKKQREFKHQNLGKFNRLSFVV